MTLKDGRGLSLCKLLPSHPFLDEHGLLRVGGRLSLSEQPYNKCHPMIFAGKHEVTRMIIEQAHQDLLHAGLTLIATSLSNRFHVLEARRIIRSVTCSCNICRRVAGNPTSWLLGKLLRDQVNPELVFSHTGVDYVGPVLIKSVLLRKPLVTKTYICVFVSFSVKAVHLELVTELTNNITQIYDIEWKAIGSVE